MPAPLRALVFVAFGSSPSDCRNSLKSGSLASTGWTAVLCRYRSKDALLRSMNSQDDLCSFWPDILIFVMPITLFSGAGGIIRPVLKYLSFNLSCNPRKSENRRCTENVFFLNDGKLVLVSTLYTIYALIPSPTLVPSPTLISRYFSSPSPFSSCKRING
uniref:Uncharacterized protein n=1 Tax=Panstrongylus lignarius TaxID=156445 RepID=A0A224XMN7_9HEMI